MDPRTLRNFLREQMAQMEANVRLAPDFLEAANLEAIKWWMDQGEDISLDKLTSMMQTDIPHPVTGRPMLMSKFDYWVKTQAPDIVDRLYPEKVKALGPTKLTYMGPSRFMLDIEDLTVLDKNPHAQAFYKKWQSKLKKGHPYKGKAWKDLNTGFKKRFAIDYADELLVHMPEGVEILLKGGSTSAVTSPVGGDMVSVDNKLKHYKKRWGNQANFVENTDGSMSFGKASTFDKKGVLGPNEYIQEVTQEDWRARKLADLELPDGFSKIRNRYGPEWGLTGDKRWFVEVAEKLDESKGITHANARLKVKHVAYDNAKSAMRRALRLDAIPLGMTAWDWQEIERLYKLAADNGWHVDHIKSLYEGGEHAPWNMQVLDARDNLVKGAKSNDLFNFDVKGKYMQEVGPMSAEEWKHFNTLSQNSDKRILRRLGLNDNPLNTKAAKYLGASILGLPLTGIIGESVKAATRVASAIPGEYATFGLWKGLDVAVANWSRQDYNEALRQYNLTPTPEKKENLDYAARALGFDVGSVVDPTGISDIAGIGNLLTNPALRRALGKTETPETDYVPEWRYDIDYSQP